MLWRETTSMLRNGSLASFVLCLFVILATAPAHAVDHAKGAGEPYRLLGKRLVFTTWDFVRPGQLDWQNDQGESVYANSRIKAGPFDDHLVLLDAPTGIRLVAEPAQRGE